MPLDPIARWTRYRAIARAYDGALALTEHVQSNARVLDVGCGRGFVAHHLAALGRSVTGIDLDPQIEAPIPYRQFDGAHLPFDAATFDTVLFSYVLHHTTRAGALLREAARVLAPGGRIVVLEDIPDRWHDRLLCLWHDARWRARTGPCTFMVERAWRDLFDAIGLRVVDQRPLPRLRNATHPVLGALFVLERAPT